MPSYLLRTDDDKSYRIVEADSAKEAVDDFKLTHGTVEVWTLRSGEPRVYEVKTESVRTVKLV